MHVRTCRREGPGAVGARDPTHATDYWLHHVAFKQMPADGSDRESDGVLIAPAGVWDLVHATGVGRVL